MKDHIENLILEFRKKHNPLNTIPTMEILSMLERYKKIDLKRISNKKLFNLTLETIPCCNVGSRSYISGSKFYRVREYFGKNYENINELSYKPKHLVTKMGRLNDVGESMLYVSNDQITPFYEVKAKVGGKYTAICYEVREGLKLLAYVIGGGTNPNDTSLNEQGKINSTIIDQFFYTEFTRDVGKGIEYLYRISNMLAKNFFDMPGCEAYEYPSVALNRNKNLAVKPEAVDKKLKIVSVENIELKTISENEVEFNRISIATRINDKTIEYYDIKR
ncbi:hypothetical protein [Clostridium kluyveri]|uniref:RES domain-containing protein n=1 Tax=Clostridium kluyveri TaxID=1534 RepID=A0A1L5FC01_CLOKL|nr:hypothetical protein [Clostridium kluyveri]APM40534.1 hypothetical protein BS101_18280 [Clostridium kluyveri]